MRLTHIREKIDSFDIPVTLLQIDFVCHPNLNDNQLPNIGADQPNGTTGIYPQENIKSINNKYTNGCKKIGIYIDCHGINGAIINDNS